MTADEDSEAPEKSDAEVFARLIFYGVSLLGRSEREVWMMPIGELLDQWEIFKQYNGMTNAGRERTIDDVLPPGVI